MERAFKVISGMYKQGILTDYAICGAVALMYYTEPFATFDIDIFFIPSEKDKIIVLTPFYDYLIKKRGYKTFKEYVMIEETPLQFIPTSNELEKEAVKNAIKIKYKDIELKIVRIEYLVAIFLQVFRKKDIAKLVKIYDQVKLDKNLLRKVLKKYKLEGKLKNFKEKYYA